LGGPHKHSPVDIQSPNLYWIVSSLTSNSSGILAPRLTFSLTPKSRLLSPIIRWQGFQQPRFMSTTNSDEVLKAQEAATSVNQFKDDNPSTIFDKIICGDIPCNKVFEDDVALAFRDISPQAPTHILVIPKNRDGLTQLSKARPDQKEVLGHLLYVAQSLGKAECPNGFRIVINDGPQGAQSVYHLHVHILGGRQMEWPPG
jgi:histidine triad (HIT) family protein